MYPVLLPISTASSIEHTSIHARFPESYVYGAHATCRAAPAIFPWLFTLGDLLESILHPKTRFTIDVAHRRWNFFG